MNERIKEWKRRNREQAKRIAEEWIAKKLENYQEPTRAGTAKGDPIGFSANKYKASLYMITHPQLFDLKSIARIVQTTEGTVRVWRTQEPFQEKVEAACKELGQLIWKAIDELVLLRNIGLLKFKAEGGDLEPERGRKLAKKLMEKRGVREEDNELPDLNMVQIGDHRLILKSGISRYKKEYGHLFKTSDEMMLQKLGGGHQLHVLDDNPKNLELIKKAGDPLDKLMEVAGCLTYYNFSVTEYIISKLATKIKAGIPGYLYMIPTLDKVFKVDDEQSFKKWQKSSPFAVITTKFVIKSMIDMLSDPDAWEQLGPSKMKEIGEELKETILDQLNLLSE